jgi:hypothetical protein
MAKAKMEAAKIIKHGAICQPMEGKGAAPAARQTSKVPEAKPAGWE